MDKATIYSFLLTTIAGLSTIIGSLIIFIKKYDKDKIICASLSFASAVMITVSLTDLIPSALGLFREKYVTIFSIILLFVGINLGLILSFLIDKYLPDNNLKTNNKKLYRVGIISMLAIILHNIPEGMATFMASNTDISLGISLTIAIALHNIPEGISISVPIYYATNSKIKAISYTALSGLSELFGAIITYLFLKPFINDIIMGLLFSIIAGIMMHISLYELFPTSLKLNNKKITIFSFIFGILFMTINHLIFN